MVKIQIIIKFKQYQPIDCDLNSEINAISNPIVKYYCIIPYKHTITSLTGINIFKTKVLIVISSHNTTMLQKYGLFPTKKTSQIITPCVIECFQMNK